jgi:hypothetical protein
LRKRRRFLLIALVVPILALLIGLFLLGQTPQALPEPTALTQPSPSTTVPEPVEELPSNLLVVPEVPLGPLAIVLICFFALLIVQRRSKSSVPPKI